MVTGDTLRASNGAAFAAVEMLGGVGAQTAFLGHSLEPGGGSREVVVETFPPPRLEGPDLDLLLEEDTWWAPLVSAPEIVRIYDVGKLLDGRLFVAMERVRGIRLDAWIGRRPTPRSPAVAVDVAYPIARALAYIHELESREGASLDMSYPDLAPPRIFLAVGGLPKLLPPLLPWITSPRSEAPRIGLSYCAPECIRGDARTQRCDAYALGALLWELLTGQRPFGGAWTRSAVQAVLSEPATRVSRVARGVPRALDELIASLLAKDPRDRPTDAMVLQTLHQLHAGEAARSPELAATIPHGGVTWATFGTYGHEAPS